MKIDIRKTWRGAAAAALICGLGLAATVPARAIEPGTKSELAAVHVRVLQTEMMVAALTCDLHHQYNTVIETHGSELSRHASALKAMFRRQHGGAAQHALDQYVTQLANDASMRSIRTRSTFCQSAMALFDAALGADVNLAQVGDGLVQQASAVPSSAR